MALRLIKILPPEGFDRIDDIVDQDDIIDHWIEKTDSDHISISILADVELTEKILEDIADNFATNTDYRIILMPVAATLPKHQVEESKKDEKSSGDKDKVDGRVKRISREELYEDINEVVDFS